MHELGVVFHVIDEIEDIAAKNDVKHVNSVTLQIGTVTGIVPSYLTDCWNWAVWMWLPWTAAALRRWP